MQRRKISGPNFISFHCNLLLLWVTLDFVIKCCSWGEQYLSHAHAVSTYIVENQSCFDLEYDEFVPSVGGGVGGSGLGSQLDSELGSGLGSGLGGGSVLGDLGLRSSSGISSLIGSGDLSFSGVGDRSWVCFSGDFSCSKQGDLSLTCLSGDFSCSKQGDLSLICLSGDFSCSKQGAFSSSCSCCSSSKPGAKGSGIPAAGIGGGSTCRSFMACLIIFSVMEDCRTTIAFMRSTVFFLCVLISFLVVIISRLKCLNIALSFNLSPLLAPW